MQHSRSTPSNARPCNISSLSLAGEDWNLPKRFLAILHVVHHRITTQKVSARCTGIEISTCMPGATDSYDMRIAYMVPDVEVAIMEGDLRIAVIVDIDTGDKNNRRGEVEQSWDDWGNMTRCV